MFELIGEGRWPQVVGGWRSCLLLLRLGCGRESVGGAEGWAVGRGCDPAGRGLGGRLCDLTLTLWAVSAGLAGPADSESFSASPHLPFLLCGILQALI